MLTSFAITYIGYLDRLYHLPFKKWDRLCDCTLFIKNSIYRINRHIKHINCKDVKETPEYFSDEHLVKSALLPRLGIILLKVELYGGETFAD